MVSSLELFPFQDDSTPPLMRTKPTARSFLRVGKNSSISKLVQSTTAVAFAPLISTDGAYFLLQHHHASRKELGKAIKLYSSKGHLEYLCILFANKRKRDFSRRDLEEAFINASREGHGPVVSFLVAGVRKGLISRKIAYSAFQIAFAKGHDEVVRVLNSKYKFITPWQADRWQKRAIELGHTKLLHVVICSRGSLILQETIGSLVVYASHFAKRGHAEQIIRVLLSEGRRISQKCLEEVVSDAAYNGQAELVRLLLSEGRTISKSELGKLVREAIWYRHLEVVHVLLSSGMTLWTSDLEEFVLWATSAGLPEFVEALLRSGPISASTRLSALTQAHRVEDLTVRESLLNLLNSAPIRPVHEEGLPSHDTLLVTLGDVRANPERFLMQLSEEGIPRRVALADNLGAIDLGGVTKQFLATLFAACLDKKLFLVNSIGLPKPVDDSQKYLEVMGKIFNQLEGRNRDRADRFLTGELFGAPFYSLVKTVIEQPNLSDKELLKEVASCCEADLDLTIYTQAIRSPNLTNAALKELAESLFDPYVESIRAFTGTLNDHVERLFRSKTPQELQVHFQGEPCTVESLLASLKIREPEEPALKPAFTQKTEWLKEKIRSSDLEWRKLFVASITGNQTLNPSKKISILPSHREWAFEVHTCFNSLDIPKETMEQETFLNLLDFTIRYRGYNIG